MANISNIVISREFMTAAVGDCLAVGGLPADIDPPAFTKWLARLVQQLIRYGITLDSTLKEPVFIKSLEESFALEEQAKWFNYLYSSTDSIPNSSWPLDLIKAFEVRHGLVDGHFKKYYPAEGDTADVLRQET